MQPNEYFHITQGDVYQGATRVLENLNLGLHLGEHTAILGANGAGKSTLLKLITRDLYPVVKPGSQLRLFGQERPTRWGLHSRMGLVSHDLQQHYSGHITGLDVVLSGFFGSHGLHGHHHPSPQQRQTAHHLMERLQLQDLRQAYYQHLSCGQQRRLLIARALVHGPHLLVLDEPTAGLDIPSAHSIQHQLRTLAQTGTTLLIVTHHIHEIIPEISRCLLLQNGRVIQDGPPQHTLTSTQLSQLYQTPLNVVQQGGYYQVFPANEAPNTRP